MKRTSSVIVGTFQFYIEGWIINPYSYELHDGPGEVVWITTKNGEIVQTGLMTCDIRMVINRGSSPKMFLMSFTKGPCRLTRVLLITVHSVTLIPVLFYLYFSFVMVSLSLGATRRFLMVLPPLKYTWISILLQMLLNCHPIL